MASAATSRAERIAEYARKGVDVSGLPLQHDLVDYIVACAETGREIHLVTSAAQEIADAVAARIGGFVERHRRRRRRAP